ncbi:hypothetical protein GQ53DRAFT_884319 [Thozetella sp. PMI_491]|nr:hypothetical protein GQ53DRAFT_884319 [Thozetella sp. PMI_491]
MSRYMWLANLLQVLFGVSGVAWKLWEGYPLMNESYLLRLFSFPPHDVWHEEGFSWLKLCTGSSFTALREDWPWFSLHIFLYIGQLAGFIMLILHQTMPHKGIFKFYSHANKSLIMFSLSIIGVLGIVSDCFGLSVAMPAISLWILHVHSASTFKAAHSRTRSRNFLTAIFWVTASTHVGAFSVALAASRMPRQIAPFHIMNSLIGVPCCSNMHCSEALRREARLRQINEMTGTSSGFFMIVGLLFQVLQQKKLTVSRQLLVRMFLISLVAGPAAGGADLLLIREVVGGKENVGIPGLLGGGNNILD